MGPKVGSVGSIVGFDVGECVISFGSNVGLKLGSVEGIGCTGSKDGKFVGSNDGDEGSISVGSKVGVGSTGLRVGIKAGLEVGKNVGSKVGRVG